MQGILSIFLTKNKILRKEYVKWKFLDKCCSNLYFIVYFLVNCAVLNLLICFVLFGHN